jgi:hypothetical protein
MNFEKKYKPKNLEDIIENKENINNIRSWIKTYNDVTKSLIKNGLLKKSTKGRKKKMNDASEIDIEYSKRKGNLLIIGNHGCGKSIMIDLICKNIGYEIITLNKYDTNLINTDFIIKITKKNLLYEENEQNNKIILIDELETLITRNEKKEILNIIKDNNYNRLVPIIIISNGHHRGQLTDIKKNANMINITELSQYDMKKWMDPICKNENININSILYDNIIEHCQRDMRKILYHLNIIKNTYNNEIIDIDKLTNFDKTIKKKDFTNDLFKNTKKLLLNYNDIETCIELFQLQKVHIPLMIHENYYKCVKKINYIDIIDNFSFGDILENYIYGEQNWDLMEIYGLISCVIPSYYINKYNNGVKYVELIFASDLNKTTTKSKKNKIIKKKNNTNVSNKSFEDVISLDNEKNENQKKGEIDKNYLNKSIEELIYIKDILL